MLASARIEVHYAVGVESASRFKAISVLKIEKGVAARERDSGVGAAESDLVLLRHRIVAFNCCESKSSALVAMHRSYAAVNHRYSASCGAPGRPRENVD